MEVGSRERRKWNLDNKPVKKLKEAATKTRKSWRIKGFFGWPKMLSANDHLPKRRRRKKRWRRRRRSHNEWRKGEKKKKTSKKDASSFPPSQDQKQKFHETMDFIRNVDWQWKSRSGNKKWIKFDCWLRLVNENLRGKEKRKETKEKKN